MRTLRTSGRIDEDTMRELVSSAAVQVARAYGIGADEVARACAPATGGGFVARAVEARYTLPERRGG